MAADQKSVSSPVRVAVDPLDPASQTTAQRRWDVVQAARRSGDRQFLECATDAFVVLFLPMALDLVRQSEVSRGHLAVTLRAASRTLDLAVQQWDNAGVAGFGACAATTIVSGIASSR